MSRELLQQALDAFEAIMFEKNVDSCLIIAKNARYALREELAKPEPIYVMGQYAGEGKVVGASFGLPKGAFEFAPYTGAGEASKIKHSLQPMPEQEPVAWKYDWYGHKSDKEPRALVKDWIASVYSEVSDPTIGAHNIRPLYAAPQRKEWVGLNAKDLSEIPPSCFEGAIWADGKLKEKNT